MADKTSSLLIDKPGQQGQQYLPVATGFEQFDQALAQRVSINELVAGDHALTDAQFRYAVLAIPALLAARVLTVPNRPKVWLVDNSGGGQQLTVKTAVAAGTDIEAGARVVVASDGTNVVQFEGAALAAAIAAQSAADAAQATADAAIPNTEKGVGSGVATLDPDGKIPTAQLPDIVLGVGFSVASEAAMLALDAQPGDWAIRTDDGNHRWLLLGADPAQLSGWVRQLTTTDAPVQTVNGQLGTVLINDSNLSTQDPTAGHAASTLRTVLTNIWSAISALGNAAARNVGTGAGDVAAGNRGLSAGGDAGMIIRKVDGTDYNTGWVSEYARRQARGDFCVAAVNWLSPTEFASGTGAAGSPSAGGTHDLLSPGRNYTKGSTAGGANGLIAVGSVYGTSNNGIKLSSFASIETGIHLRIPVLSGGSDTFQVVFGLTNRANVTDVNWNTAGAYCRITGSTLDFITHNGVSGTTVTWGTAITAGTVYGLFIVWTPASVSFYVDNVLAATITTNIPTSGNIRCEAGILGLTGTTAMTINVARPGFYAPYTDAGV